MTFCSLTIKTHELVSAWKHVIWDNVIFDYRIILLCCYEGRDTMTNTTLIKRKHLLTLLEELVHGHHGRKHTGIALEQ